MNERAPLTYLGSNAALHARKPDGRVAISFACPGMICRANVWPHELRGLGWHIAAVKRAVAALPMDGEPLPSPVPKPPGATRPVHWADSGNRLHAHFAIPEGDK